jgi:hypothetical protein
MLCAAAALFAFPGSADAGVSFSPAVRVASGGEGPLYVAVQDLNHDSHPDLAVGNNISGNISVLLGNADAGFSAPVNYPSEGIGSLAVGNVNGDSHPDLLGASAGTDRVAVLLGAGDGTFGAATTFTTGPFPFSVALADFNHDSKLDIATADYLSSNVSILLGNGAGGFGTHTEFTAGQNPYSVAVGDFDRDTNPDLAVAYIGANAGIAILRGNGSGGFSAPTIIPLPDTGAQAVVVADFNEDSKPDLAATYNPGTNTSGTSWIFFGDGNGGFSAPLTYAMGGLMVAADFDSDSHTDLAIADSNLATTVLLGDGDGHFKQVFAFGAVLGTVGDFNGDGLPDMAAPSYRANEVLVTYNTTPGYVRPRGATPLRASLVPAYGACTSPDATHGAPLAFPACSPPALVSSRLTVGTPDANGAGANSIGYVQLTVKVGQPGPPEDSDVNISASLTDVRCAAVSTCGSANATGGSDYTGELQATTSARLTDGLNGPGATQIGTTSDFPFPVRLTCASSSSTSIGGSCGATTSFNALVPGAIKEGKRAVWGLGQVQVYDGGPDGDVDTPGGEAVFAAQGVFVP